MNICKRYTFDDAWLIVKLLKDSDLKDASNGIKRAYDVEILYTHNRDMYKVGDKAYLTLSERSLRTLNSDELLEEYYLEVL